MDDELRLLNAAHSGDMERLRQQAIRLAEEKRQLEQLCRLQHQLLEAIPFEPVDEFREQEWCDDAQKAEALYCTLFGEQEVKEC